MMKALPAFLRSFLGAPLPGRRSVCRLGGGLGRLAIGGVSLGSGLMALLGLADLAGLARSAAAADRPAVRAGGTAPAAATVLGPTEAALKRTLEERMSGVHIVGIVKTPYAGLYEVRTDDNEILYTDDKAAFIFVGAIRDGRDPQRNLTEERQQALSAISFSELPFEGSFKIVRGNGRRQLAYFTDPNCPYCKQLEKELTQLDDVTINVFLYPILSADSLPKSRAIWCSADRVKVWFDWMLGGVAPATAGICDSQVLDRNLAFGRRIRVTSVPTLIYPNGTRSAGMRPVAAIARAIDEASPRRP